LAAAEPQAIRQCLLIHIADHSGGGCIMHPIIPLTYKETADPVSNGFAMFENEA